MVISYVPKGGREKKRTRRVISRAFTICPLCLNCKYKTALVKITGTLERREVTDGMQMALRARIAIRELGRNSMISRIVDVTVKPDLNVRLIPHEILRNPCLDVPPRIVISQVVSQKSRALYLSVYPSWINLKWNFLMQRCRSEISKKLSEPAYRCKSPKEVYLIIYLEYYI